MRILISLAVFAAAMPASAGIVVLKNGETFVGKLDAKVLPPCPADPANMPETIQLSWPHNGIEGPEGRSTWEFKGHEVRWYDLSSDTPTAEYWEKFFDEEIEERWHAARERHRHAHQEKPIGLVPTPKVELWKGLEKRPLPHAGMAINPPQGWEPEGEAADAEPGEPSNPELPAESPQPLTLHPGEKAKGPRWSSKAPPSVRLWRLPAFQVEEDLEPWVAKKAAALAEERKEELVGNAAVRRTERGLAMTFTSAGEHEGVQIHTRWRVLMRDQGTYCVTFTAAAADLEQQEELVQRCLSTFKAQERE
ncbi:MAG: hypothetical protein KDD82_12510 [Planctomycetes bacterium]|nr:hypothetical protein [Planctomycetota bacterium]